jgi:hypothetical protein
MKEKNKSDLAIRNFLTLTGKLIKTPIADIKAETAIPQSPYEIFGEIAEELFLESERLLYPMHYESYNKDESTQTFTDYFFGLDLYLGTTNSYFEKFIEARPTMDVKEIKGTQDFYPIDITLFGKGITVTAESDIDFREKTVELIGTDEAQQIINALIARAKNLRT